MNVNTEGSNTHMMQQHALSKEAVVQNGLMHVSIDLLLNDILDARQSQVLNATAENCTIPGPFVSDADDQLIIKLNFKEKVSVSEIKFIACDEIHMRPKCVKVFANRAALDFSDVDNFEAGSCALLNDSDCQQSITLIGTKFTRVESIQIFVESSHGAETTKIAKIAVIGHPTPSYHVEYKTKN